MTAKMECNPDSDFACTVDSHCTAKGVHVLTVDGLFDGFAACDEHREQVLLQAIGFYAVSPAVGQSTS